MPKAIDYKIRKRQVSLKLVESGYLNRLKYSPVHNSFVLHPKKKDDKEIRLSGITKKLKKHFYPNYVYSRNRYSTGTGVRNASEGRNRGTIVHRQIRDFFNMSDTKFFDRYRSPTAKKKDPLKEEIHEYTQKLVLAMDKWGLEPIVSELPVMDLKRKVATAVDGLCIDKKTGSLVMLEWKCGFDHYLNQGNAQMLGPKTLTKYSNCPLNQAKLQLAFTKDMFEKTYDIPVEYAWVINLTQQAVMPHSLNSDFTQVVEKCYPYFNVPKKKKK